MHSGADSLHCFLSPHSFTGLQEHSGVPPTSLLSTNTGIFLAARPDMLASSLCESQLSPSGEGNCLTPKLSKLTWGSHTSRDWINVEIQRLRPLPSIQDMFEGLFKLRSSVLGQLRSLLQQYHSSTLLPKPTSQTRAVPKRLSNKFSAHRYLAQSQLLRTCPNTGVPLNLEQNWTESWRGKVLLRTTHCPSIAIFLFMTPFYNPT